MILHPTISDRASKAVPAVTFGLLLVMPLVFPNRTTVDASLVAQQAAVRAAVESSPYRVGGWIGTDITVPLAATKLLRPNAILSRQFRRIGGGPAVNLLLVHCTDVRDMRGHYPPVCYPSTGWSFVGEKTGKEATLTVNGRRAPIRVYEFRRIEGEVREVRIRVFNVFVLPDGTLTPEIDQIKSLSERLALSAQGVAQLQIVTPLEMSLDEAVGAARDILEGMPGLMNALRVWKEPDDG